MEREKDFARQGQVCTGHLGLVWPIPPKPGRAGMLLVALPLHCFAGKPIPSSQPFEQQCGSCVVQTRKAHFAALDEPEVQCLDDPENDVGRQCNMQVMGMLGQCETQVPRSGELKKRKKGQCAQSSAGFFSLRDRMFLEMAWPSIKGG
eukprot:636544-Amphidinium_carterae.1